MSEPVFLHMCVIPNGVKISKSRLSMVLSHNPDVILPDETTISFDSLIEEFEFTRNEIYDIILKEIDLLSECNIETVSKVSSKFSMLVGHILLGLDLVISTVTVTDIDQTTIFNVYANAMSVFYNLEYLRPNVIAGVKDQIEAIRKSKGLDV